MSMEVITSRPAVVILAAVSLIFAYWYLKGWFWLSKSSLRRLGGLALMAVFSVCIPLAIYRTSAALDHRDFIGGVIMLEDVVLIGMLLYETKRKSVAEAGLRGSASGG
jgi:hypothetical protein